MQPTSNALANAMRQQADLHSQTVAKNRTGFISSYNPASHSVKVTLQPDNIDLPGWIPLGAVGVGNGFGVATAPNVGDMVEVGFSEGSTRSPRIIGRFFSNIATPPVIPAGETWIIHQTTSSVKLTTQGQVTAQDKAGSTVILNGDGTGSVTFADGFTINANTTINGTLTVTEEITGEGGMAISGTNSSGVTSTVTGNLATTGTITNNGKHIDSTHTHGNGNGGAPTTAPL